MRIWLSLNSLQRLGKDSRKRSKQNLFVHLLSQKLATKGWTDTQKVKQNNFSKKQHVSKMCARLLTSMVKLIDRSLIKDFNESEMVQSDMFSVPF